MKIFVRRVVLVLVIGILGLLSSRLPDPGQKSAQISHEATSSSLLRVARVVDGDTIELVDGRRVRYIGIDTPETVDPKKAVQCFGKEASAENKRLVEGKDVRLEKDVSETDRYGRLLRYVYVGDTMINDVLVRQGFAHISTFPPDVAYADQFKEAERQAREANRGLWAGCAK